jgi:hypothetical protein
MADGPKAIEVPGSWIGTDELPLHFVNAFAAMVGPNAVFISLGSFTPPNVGGATDEEREAQARAIAYVPIMPVARVALAPAGLDELIAMLEETRNNYQMVRDAADNQGGDDD